MAKLSSAQGDRLQIRKNTGYEPLFFGMVRFLNLQVPPPNVRTLESTLSGPGAHSPKRFLQPCSRTQVRALTWR